ncbi:hypothetical protein Bca4012_058480 [Brassica carinata]
MAASGARIIAHWELMREWLKKQTSRWDLARAFDQYKTVMLAESQSKGVDPPHFRGRAPNPAGFRDGVVCLAKRRTLSGCSAVGGYSRGLRTSLGSQKPWFCWASGTIGLDPRTPSPDTVSGPVGLKEPVGSKSGDRLIPVSFMEPVGSTDP